MDPGPCWWECFVFRYFLNFGRVSVLHKKVRRERFLEDGMRFSPPSLRPGGASSDDGVRVEVCLWWILQNLIGVCLW